MALPRNHNALKTRECVLQKFWQDQTADRFGRRGGTPQNAQVVPKSVFSDAMTIMDKKKMGGVDI